MKIFNVFKKSKGLVPLIRPSNPQPYGSRPSASGRKRAQAIASKKNRYLCNNIQPSGKKQVFQMRTSHRKQGIMEKFLLANSAMRNRFKGQYRFL
jgi:hypothetical protein